MDTQAARRLDEPGGPGLEPETILPSQFFDRFQIDASLQPEKRLMLAVLEDAVGAFQKYVTSSTRRGQRLFAEAEEWFAAPACDGFVVSATHVPGAYEDFVCHVVPELQRRGLFRREFEGTSLRENLGVPVPARGAWR